MKKRFISAVLVFAVLLPALLPSAMASSPIVFTVTADKDVALPGEEITFSVSVNAKEASSYGGIQFDLLIPEGLVYVPDSGKVDDRFEEISGAQTFSFTELTLRTIAAAENGFKCLDNLTMITFKCRVSEVDNAVCNVSLSIREDDVTDESFEATEYNIVPKTIAIGEEPILPDDPEPTPPVDPEPIPPVDDPIHENCPSAKFTDVDQDLWYHDGIDYVIDNGLMNGVGDTLFAPNGTTNRAMIVTILHRLEGTPDGGDASFGDVADGQWYSEAVGWAAANGIVTGYSADTFGPMNPITREQMAAILYRYAQYKGCDVSEMAGLEAFGDAGTVSSYAVPALEWAVGAELINGMDGNLNPKGTATRAQVATILMRFCENVAN